MLAKSLRRLLQVGLLSSLVFSTGCLGPSHLTGRLFDFNKDIEGKWTQEGVFVLLLPAYVVTSFGDKLIFNSVQWWTGENPIDPPKRGSDVGL
jgi:hypothetical protein